MTIFCSRLENQVIEQITLNAPHVPVLYREICEAFVLTEPCTMVDCTLGYAGHSAMLLEQNPNMTLIGIDRDETAIAYATKMLQSYQSRVTIRQGAYSEVLPDVIETNEKIGGVLADIGVSSLQLDQRERGFSYESDVLDMRMDQSAEKSAADVINHYTQHALEKVLRDYGEIRNAAKIASVIVANRPFHSARALAEAVRPFAPRGKKIHPATLVMQAIRIEVNDELGELERMLDTLERAATHGMRIGIITFHSLEDRIVKQRFVKWARACICPPEAPRCVCGANHAIGKIVNKKPITAQEDELKTNPRSRSAKLRLFDMRRDER